MSTEMSFLDHLEELRSRILYAFFGMLVPIILAMIYYEQLFEFMMLPIRDMGLLDELLGMLGIEFVLQGTRTPAILQAINPTDTFLAAIKIAVTVGIFSACPWIFYQAWRFVGPALTQSEKNYTLPVVLSASTFFLIGGTFAYFIVLPFALNFLANFGGDLVANQWAISFYFDLVLQFVLVFGIVFEMPLLAFILAKLDLISAEFLKSYRRYAVVIAVVLAAVLTPPDVVSQIMLAIPLIILYEFSIIIVRIFKPKNPFVD